MKYRGCISCIVGIALFSGCVVDPGGDSPSPTDVQITWDLISGDGNDPASCPDNATVEVIGERIDDGDEVVGDGDEVIAFFDCTAQRGTLDPVPSGRYLIWINILDPAETLLAQSTSQEVDIILGGPLAVEYTVSLDRGSFGLSWSLLADGVATVCGAADTVEVVSTRTDVADVAFTDLFSCAVTGAITPVLPLGAYRVRVSLLDAEQSERSIPFEVETTLDFGNDHRELGHFEFAVAQ